MVETMASESGSKSASAVRLLSAAFVLAGGTAVRSLEGSRRCTVVAAGTVPALLVAVGLLASCVDTSLPPEVLVDSGPDTGVDGGSAVYDPVMGMPFEGPLLLDDDRVRALDGSTLRAGSPACHPPALVRVIRAYDGDTLHVEGLDGRSDTTVRVIGVNAPEIGSSPECYGVEARDFVRMSLGGRWVWLTFGGRCTDAFGRTLAYVHLGGGDRDMLTRQLLRRGYGRFFVFPDNPAFADVFRADEEAARAAGAGLWSACR
jgi:micrococcal nuclease